MRPIVNVPEKDRAMVIGNMHKKFGKDGAWGSGDILSDRQTDRRNDALITILSNCSRRPSNKCAKYCSRKKTN